jgi:hypothetical protein
MRCQQVLLEVSTILDVFETVPNVRSKKIKLRIEAFTEASIAPCVPLRSLDCLCRFRHLLEADYFENMRFYQVHLHPA